ncbi:MAG: hypothetical protein ACYTF1_13510 [Planctomycetota bacterium]|jgi:hypothetical protein
MSDQPAESKWTDYSEKFPFIRIFRTFKLATHPNKLALALVGVILTVLWGCILDMVWSSNHQPIGNETNAFWQVPNIDQWREQTRQGQYQQLASIYLTELDAKTPDKLNDRFNEDPNKTINKAIEKLENQYKEKIDDADEEVIAETARKYNLTHRRLKALKTVGIFKSFISYEQGVCHQLFNAACTLNFAGQFDHVLRGRHNWTADAEKKSLEDIGVIPCLMLMARGKQWMAMEHPLFCLLFLVVTLAIWAMIGGAICRIAALHFARDERISYKEALAFAARKFIAFFTAPLLPIALIIFIGVFLIIGGLVGAIPYIGEIFAGAAMGLALLGGFVMALVAIGLLAGGNLLWPTIAVEGSDSFDAMSRSYSYIYTKPWRTGFYAIIAIVYGAICYMFVRFFIFVMLKATRFFVGIGLEGTDRPGTGILDNSKLDVIWPLPTFGNFRAPAPPFGAEQWDTAGTFLIGIWLLIVVGLMVAFLISFFYSGSTIIYYLLRREVDATDIEDVYLQEDLEEEDQEAKLDEAIPTETETPPEEPETTTTDEAEKDSSSEDSEEQ